MHTTLNLQIFLKHTLIDWLIDFLLFLFVFISSLFHFLISLPLFLEITSQISYILFKFFFQDLLLEEPQIPLCISSGRSYFHGMLEMWELLSFHWLNPTKRQETWVTECTGLAPKRINQHTEGWGDTTGENGVQQMGHNQHSTVRGRHASLPTMPLW